MQNLNQIFTLCILLCVCKSIAKPIETTIAERSAVLPSTISSTEINLNNTQQNSTAETTDVDSLKTSEPTPFQSPIIEKLANDEQIDDRTWRKKKKLNMQMLNDVFQIPIKTLMAVNNLLLSILGEHVKIEDSSFHNNKISQNDPFNIQAAFKPLVKLNN